MKYFTVLLISITFATVFAINKKDKEFAVNVYKQSKLLRPLHEKMEEPLPGDWLSCHEEEGQTFSQYMKCNPVLPNKTRKIIYLQPIGKLTGNYKKIIEDTSKYLVFYYGLEVKLLKAIPASLVPEESRREGGFYGTQLLTTHILYNVLQPRLPKDGACIIGLSKYDLWPGKGWNFVFGQANTRRRVGVWSLKRFGIDDKEVAYETLLKRTVKTAVHEIGHMFTIKHCIHYQCVMNGSNSLHESDRRPLYACPQCLCKFLLLTHRDMSTHFQFMENYCRALKFNETADFYEKSLQALSKKQISTNIIDNKQ